MLQQHGSSTIQHGKSRLYHSVARTPYEVAEAQCLRYKVFAKEMGAHLKGHDGLDRDGFDAFCDHLLVRDAESGEVVGTYRILTPAMALAAGGYYSENEFDLTRLLHLAPGMVEVGRSCVHPAYRSGPAIWQLWNGLAKYMKVNAYHYLIGCASIGMGDGGHNAASIYTRLLRENRLSPQEYRVFPRYPLPMDTLRCDLDASCPPLVKGYLRLGAYICGEPAWDPDFNTADLLVMLPLSRMNQRYAAHLLGS